MEAFQFVLLKQYKILQMGDFNLLVGTQRIENLYTRRMQEALPAKKQAISPDRSLSKHHQIKIKNQ
jgi:hypothetical protein